MSKEAMKLALEALEGVVIPSWRLDEIKEQIIALKQALEQPEPVECHTCKGLGRIYMGCGSWIHCDTCNTTGKATTPPKREPEPEPVIDRSAAIRIATSLGWTPKRELLTDEQVNLVREMRDVQGQHGNWNYDPYMQGLYNGLEFAMSLLEKRELVFRDAPKQWLGDITIKRDKFNSVEECKPTTGIKGEEHGTR